MLGGKEVYQWAGGSFEAHSACCEFGGEGYNWGIRILRKSAV